ncbi:MAG TPA: hypothetical protein VHG70_17365 [Nocardioidaceae bacterium]|nr:hypothetical protein [Nocardioidaceae bacterium]
MGSRGSLIATRSRWVTITAGGGDAGEELARLKKRPLRGYGGVATARRDQNIAASWSVAVNLEMTRTVETLAAEFKDLLVATVIQVVTDCLEESPDSGPMFIEKAARARLKTIPNSSGGRRAT